ncbi:C45 family peptidase [bacterium]|nr:C45 family peptidase [bacterium]
MRRQPLTALLLVLTLSACAGASEAPYPAGKASHVNGYLVLHLAGDGEQLGHQQARLAGRLVKRVVKEVLLEGEAAGAKYEPMMRGAAVMERYLPEEWRAELKALARDTGLRYLDLVALQLFGDIQRGQRCTTYAALGPATRSGECIVGRNMDFWDHGVSRYAGCILHYTPSTGLPFMTVSWCGIINGWTAMNSAGIVCANNTAYGGKDTIEGLSTCFMIRKVAQYARTVEEGVRIVQETPRACGTNLLIAGGNPPAAAIVEFDHDKVAVRWAHKGYVCADNSFRLLGQVTTLAGFEGDAGSEAGPRTESQDLLEDDSFGGYWLSRDQLLAKLIRTNFGLIDDSMNFAAAEGVPIRSINLQSALLFPQRLTFRLSMGKVPAADQAYRRFAMTHQGIVSDN